MPTYQPFDWYETPLYYDIVFDAETATEADFLCAVMEKHGETSSARILEPACGTGRLVIALAERGHDVTGFDLSDASLAFARMRLDERGLKARLVNADMANFELRGPGFDLAHCLVSSFKYLLTEHAARSHLQCVVDALNPGGLYVLGVHITDYGDRRKNRERWVAERNGIRVVCNIQGWPADRQMRRELVRSRLIVHEDDGERRFETHWTFRTYGYGQLKSLLKSVPDLEHIATYDFRHDITKPAKFDGIQLDVVLVLRRT